MTDLSRVATNAVKVFRTQLLIVEMTVNRLFSTFREYLRGSNLKFQIEIFKFNPNIKNHKSQILSQKKQAIFPLKNSFFSINNIFPDNSILLHTKYIFFDILLNKI